MYPKVMEADDVISWICKNEKGKKIIVTSDQDFWQLIDEDISVYNAIKKVEINQTNFNQHSPVFQDQFLIYKCFIGDVSDNIGGVRGIGKVRAKRLLENWPENKDVLTEEQTERLDRNVRLMDLSYGYTVHDGEEQCYKNQFEDLSSLETNFPKFKERSKELELQSFVAGFSVWEEVFGGKRMADGVNSLIERLGLNK
jgi:5'-3' exonuclease